MGAMYPLAGREDVLGEPRAVLTRAARGHGGLDLTLPRWR